MAGPYRDFRWDSFNAAQVQRAPRGLAVRAVQVLSEQVAPGAVIHVVDIGAGAGVETRLFLEQGWQVLAFDSAETSRELITNRAGELASELHFVQADFADISNLPPAGLIYSGFALPFASPTVFKNLWVHLIVTLKPGGLLAINFFGDVDEWAQADKSFTFFSRSQVDTLLSGFEVLYLLEEEGEKPAFEGTKYWHTFDVIARKR